MSRILDIRLVIDRDDRVRVSIDGRRVTAIGRHSSIPDALVALASKVGDAAYVTDRATAEEIADAGSRLYEVAP